MSGNSLFVSRTGMFWKDGRQKSFEALVSRASGDPEVHKNFFAFVSWLDSVIESPTLTREETIAADPDIIATAWQGAMARRLNPRTAGSLAEVRERFHARIDGLSLEVPAWWPAKEIPADESAAPPAESTKPT